MALKFSTALRNGLLATGALRTLLNGGEIRIWSGPVPATSNDAVSVSNTLLVTIKAEGAGLTFEATANDGTITKNLAEIWTGVCGASGTATFYRHVLSADANDASTSAVRIQGEVALSGKDLSLSSTTLTAGAVQKIDFYSISMLEQ
jgi:hypothetical protein